MRKVIVVFLAVAFFAWLAYGATGSRFGGETAEIADIPIVGNDVHELELTLPAVYHGFEHPHGGGTFTIVGATKPESMDRFCSHAEISRSMDGTDIQGRDVILKYLRNHDVKIPDADNLTHADVLFGIGGRFRKLYGVYDGPTNRFWITLQFDGSK